jgi:hypothetical protein
MIWFGIHAVMLLLSELVNSMKTQLIQITILKKKLKLQTARMKTLEIPNLVTTMSMFVGFKTQQEVLIFNAVN